MTQLATSTLASTASLAAAITALNNLRASTATVVNAAVEGGAATNPNIAANTVDRTNMRANAKVGVYAAESGASGFVVTEGGTKGLEYVSASLLVATYASGSAHVRQISTSPDELVRVTKTTTWTVALTATSDNYVYIKSDASVGVATAAVGGPVPSLPTDSLLLSIATTDGTTVTGTPVSKGPTSTSTSPRHWRSKGAWPFPTTTTSFRLPPGQIEVDGITSDQSANQDLDVTVAGNYVLGARTSNVHLYFLVGNNGGTPKFALTTSAPSAATVVGGVTSGTVGSLQYRKIGSVAYRYLGSARMSTTGVMQLFARNGRQVILGKSQLLISTAISASTFATAGAASTTMPATSKVGIFGIRGGNGTDSSIVYIRPTSTSAAGTAMLISSNKGTSVQAIVPTNAKHSFDYRMTNPQPSPLRVDAHGYYDTELD